MTDQSNAMPGVSLIADERRRQIEDEKWTPSHDLRHVRGELVNAAVCYALALEPGSLEPKRWPWESRWWKPSDRLRNLVKAGALIAAEIDRRVAMLEALERRQQPTDWESALVSRFLMDVDNGVGHPRMLFRDNGDGTTSIATIEDLKAFMRQWLTVG